MPDLTAVEMSLRESARRFIRMDGCNIHHPHLYAAEVSEIIDAFSEFLPARLKLPIRYECDDDQFSIFDEKNVLIAQVGGLVPELSVSWTEGEIDRLFVVFQQQVAELLAAGYPGCAGCGGPGNESEWDEENSRRQQVV
jgi:hypothetical protein